MKAADIMVPDVVAVRPDATIVEVANLMMHNDVSALPVVDENGHLVGIISEADLLQREETGTEVRRPWWLEAMTPATTLATEFIKSHGKRVYELMSKDVVTATEDTPLAEVAALLQRNRIKRIPIVRGRELVGVVSQTNLVQALASSATVMRTEPNTSRTIKHEILSRLKQQTWSDFESRNVIVTGSEVHLWGLVGSESERKALTALAEGVDGVKSVVDEMISAY